MPLDLGSNFSSAGTIPTAWLDMVGNYSIARRRLVPCCCRLVAGFAITLPHHRFWYSSITPQIILRFQARKEPYPWQEKA
jgi:hypothetical protein